MKSPVLSIPLGSLVLLSGPPGCGKSTACQSLPESWVVSSDRLRASFFGRAKALVDGQVAERPMALDDGLVFGVMEQVVRSRLKAGLTTLVDATLISDQERKPFAAIARALHVPLQVIIFDLPEAQVRSQNKSRACPVPDAVVSHFCQRLQRDSQWPYTMVTAACELVPNIPTIPASTALDVIGDVHGLADTLQKMLMQLGYDTDFNHPDGRKLCFLGDLVDRGLQSLAVLELVMNAVERGHYCIRGNHDHNLLRGLWGENLRSRATRETLHHLLKTEPEHQQRVERFLLALPTFYRIEYQSEEQSEEQFHDQLHDQPEQYILCHGDLEWFDPLLQPGREHMYGRCKINENYDTDGVFRRAIASSMSASSMSTASHSVQAPVLIRGHMPLTSPGEGVVSLEAGAGFGGPLVAMRLPEREIVNIACDYNYNQRMETLGDRLDLLVSKKWVKRVSSPCGQLNLYKYTSKAFFSPTLWGDYPELKLARGVVMGLHGKPVNHPFPRTFNYGERDGMVQTTLPPKTPIVAIEKLNGFLVTTFLHPYDRTQLLVTCSGSFEGEYVELAKSLVYSSGLYGKLLKWLRQHPTVTLLWEAIHRDDPHIIQYRDDQCGLHLIGAGDLAFEDLAFEDLAFEDLASRPLVSRHLTSDAQPAQQSTAGFWPEAALDELATQLDVPRPSWFACVFVEALEAVKTVEHEGFMIRLADGSFALKLKSPYYLHTKFLSRMTEKKARFMFSNAYKFKQELDEALWPLVDRVMANCSLDAWLAWSNLERRDWLQQSQSQDLMSIVPS